MSTKIYANARFGFREDTLENWIANNPVLEKGEPAVVRDGENGEWLKIGDGVTAFNNLPWKKGPKGDNGDSYVLTEADKEEIASMVEVSGGTTDMDDYYTKEEINDIVGDIETLLGGI